MLKLFIANKNYSSWSMRPWVLMTQAGIAFQEELIGFDSFEADSDFKRKVLAVNPAGKVPVLLDTGHQPDLVVWDTLAITEYLAERFPEKRLWPAYATLRARARSICAEMHAGFNALRGNCPMNIEAELPDAGALIWRDKAAVRADVARLVRMWSELLDAHGGPMLFKDFSVADAYFAPVCMRFKTYALPLPQNIADSVQRVCELPGVAAWMEGARAEQDFIPFEEPYRLKR